MTIKPLLVGVNGFFLIVVLALALLVDSNGRVIGLSAAVSTAVTASVFATAFIAAGLLTVKGHSWARRLGIALGILYAAMLFPLFMP